MKIRRLDNVVVLKGKDRGKTGQVSRILPREDLLLVKGINKVKKHQKPDRRNPRTGIIYKEMPLRAENVGVVCSHCNKIVKISFSQKSGKKIRICKKCQGSLEHETTRN